MMKYILYLLIILLSDVLLLLSCMNGRETPATQLPENSFYSISDFDSVKKIDTHIHLNTDETTFIEQAAADNLQFLDIVDDRPFGVPMNEQESIAIKQTKAFPQRVEYATTFSVSDFNRDGWQTATIDHIKSSIQNGAIAVKVWKNIGMDLKDSDGKFVMIDNPAFDTILNFLAQNKVPLIGHLGEPRECWLPLSQMVLHKGYYSEHPEYHMYLHPEFPSYEKQVQARDKMLEKHPDLIFIGAHLGSIEWSLDELSKRLDKYPNMSVDLARDPFRLLAECVRFPGADGIMAEVSARDPCQERRRALDPRPARPAVRLALAPRPAHRRVTSPVRARTPGPVAAGGPRAGGCACQVRQRLRRGEVSPPALPPGIA